MEELRARLPEYMVPVVLMEVERMPLTANGKIDKRSLPPVDISSFKKDYVAPESDLEKQLSEIWSELLKVDRVGLEDNFFELGGHSLLTIQVIRLIKKRLGYEIPINLLFENATIKELSLGIGKLQNDILPNIVPVASAAHYEVSDSQRRLWMTEQINPSAKKGFIIPISFIIEGPLDAEFFFEAIKDVENKHEILRTNFIEINGEPRQIIHTETRAELIYRHETTVKDARDMIKQITRRLFSLEKDPLLRVHLFKTGQNRFVCLFCIHHIVFDGFSIDIFVKEISSFYKSRRNHGSFKQEGKRLKIQYKDYAAWHNRWQETVWVEQQKKIWLGEFKGKLPRLKLPTDFSRPEIMNFNGDSVSILLDEELLVAIRKKVSANETSLFTYLFAAFNILLYRCSHQQEIIIGFPFHGRNKQEFQQMIGMFVNMLAIRSVIDPNNKFEDFLSQQKEKVKKALSCSDLQYDELIHELGIGIEMNRNPLFDVVFVMNSFQHENINNTTEDSAQDLILSPSGISAPSSRFDLMLSATEYNNLLEVVLTYSTSLFKRETIESILRHYKTILEEVTDNAGVLLRDIRISDLHIRANPKLTLDTDDFVF
jgi:acyl carrier protein